MLLIITNKINLHSFKLVFTFINLCKYKIQDYLDNFKMDSLNAFTNVFISLFFTYCFTGCKKGERPSMNPLNK